jgi:hypothetical protein
MKKYLLRVSQILSILIVGSVILLYLTRSRPVLMRIPPDDTIRPRYYCVLNPFRNKAPEQLAEQHLNKLREGKVEVIAPFLDERTYILEKEKQWPIQSWRIGDRQDTADRVKIMYWVKRDNGYANEGYEDSVFFWMNCSGENCQVKTYAAVY